MRESMRAPIPEKEINKEIKMGFQEAQEKYLTRKALREKINNWRFEARVPAKEGVHTFESLEKKIADLEDIFAALGYQEIKLDEEQTLNSYDKKLLAVKTKVKKDDRETGGSICLEIDPEQNIVSYRESTSNEIIETVSLPPEFEMDFLEQASRQAKVVKSRPMFLYPELFDLPPEEVFPKEEKIAVIGDPYQLCDREGITIVEYEYAEEITPPTLYNLVTEEPFHQDDITYWYDRLHYEDFRALETMYGFYTPSDANPYYVFFRNCHRECGKSTESAFLGNFDLEKERRILKEKKNTCKKLTDGSWTPKEGAEICGLPREDDENLMTWFEYKQATLEKLGNPKEWSEFTALWEEYLDNLPKEYLRQHLPNLEEKTERAKQIIIELPKMTSPKRVSDMFSELTKFYDQVSTYYQDEVEESHSLRNPGVAFACDREDGAFGYFVPGFPVSMRTRRILEEGVMEYERTINYLSELLPHLKAEKQRIEEAGYNLSKETLFFHLRSLEKAWQKQHAFQRRTEKAIPVHGFFPHNMPEMDPQDRIIALTSVTMHGWNSMRESEFYAETEKALGFLKIGGKYILGPVNQYVYFGGENSDFDAEGLTGALKQLEKEGKINYYYKKGRGARSQDWEYSYGSSEEDWEKDESVLYSNEAASALVIERIR